MNKNTLIDFNMERKRISWALCKQKKILVSKFKFIYLKKT